MPYYHVQVKHKDPKYPLLEVVTTDNELDLLEEEVRTIAEQYDAGCFLFRGKWIEAPNVKEIEVRETEHKPTIYFPNLSSFSIFQGQTYKEVTRKFIKSPPRELAFNKKEKATHPLSKNVFIVHGRDHEPMKELKALLIDSGFNPMVLHEQASGGLTLAEKLEECAGKIGYAFIILTPDDIGGDRNEMRKRLGGDTPLLSRPITVLGGSIVDKILDLFEPRARQNVIFEMGYFWGFLQRKRVCCLLKGNVEKPSDIDGIVYVHFENSVSEAKEMILKELREAGYDIKPD